MKTIGIIGGLGPMATVYFMERIIDMTAAETDQDYPRIYLQSIPDTPDRTGFILGENEESPVPFLVRAGRELERQGADFLAVPCVTAQYFYQELSAAVTIPVISLCGDIAEEMEKKKIKKVGILATSGTIRTGVLAREFNRAGIENVIPSDADQKLVMELIYGQIKKGTPVNWELFERVSGALLAAGAERIVLGCTELSLLKKNKDFGDTYVDVLDVLARRTVLASGACLRREYEDIIR